jgi:hypothetical protein
MENGILLGLGFNMKKTWKTRILFFSLPLIMLFFFLLNHGRALQFDFIWDDKYTIARADNLFEGSIKYVFSASESDFFYQKNSGSKPVNITLPSYRPIRFLSFWLDAHLFGRDALMMHLHSLILGLVFFLTFYLVSFLILRSYLWAFVPTILILVHPLTVENIVYLTARIDLILAIFSFLCLGSGFLLRAKANSKIPPIFQIIACGFFYFCALCSKENALFLPLALIPLWSLMGIRRIRALSLSLSFFLFAYWSLRWALHIPSAKLLINFKEVLSPLPVALTEYWRAFYFPIDLSISRTARIPESVGWAFVFFHLLLPLVALRITPAIRRHVFIYLIAILNLTLTITVTLPALISVRGYQDRYALIPLGILLISLAIILKERWENFSPRLRHALTGIGILSTIFFGFFSAQLAATYENDQTLFTYNLQMNPQNPMAHFMAASLGEEKIEGYCAYAGPFLFKALELDPYFAKTLINLGSCSLNAGRFKESRDYFIRAAKSGLWAFQASSFIAFARARFALNEIQKGCALLLRAVRIEPDHPEIPPLTDRYCTLPEDDKKTETNE